MVIKLDGYADYSAHGDAIRFADDVRLDDLVGVCDYVL